MLRNIFPSLAVDDIRDGWLGGVVRGGKVLLGLTRRVQCANLPHPYFRKGTKTVGLSLGLPTAIHFVGNVLGVGSQQ